MGLNADEITIIVLLCVSAVTLAVFVGLFIFFRYRKHPHVALRRLTKEPNYHQPMLDGIVGRTKATQYRLHIMREARDKGIPFWKTEWYKSGVRVKDFDLLVMHDSIDSLVE